MSITSKTKNFVLPVIPEDKISAARKEVLDKIIVARIGMMMRYPFIGNLSTRLQIAEGSDWCKTAATDGRTLYYNLPFFTCLSVKQVEFVIAHEVLHCVFDHFTRKEDRDHNLHNIACDYIVNNILIRDRVGEVVDQIPIFADTKYTDWTSEAVYDDLLKNSSSSDQFDLGQLLDEHGDWSTNSNDPSNSAKNGKAPTFSKEEFDKIRDEIREAVLSAAQAVGASGAPAEIQRMIKDLTEPKMNWRQLLRQQIQGLAKHDFSFTRPSRKAWHTGAILPGQITEQRVEIAVAIDTSGSISDDQVRDFLSEIKGITDSYSDFNISLWCFDTSVHNFQVFSSENNEDITEYVPGGGGGTEFGVNWSFMKENDMQPKKFIMFTDMYPNSDFGDPVYCDTIFINHGRPGFEAPFGVTVEYECAPS